MYLFARLCQQKSIRFTGAFFVAWVFLTNVRRAQTSQTCFRLAGTLGLRNSPQDCFAKRPRLKAHHLDVKVLSHLGTYIFGIYYYFKDTEQNGVQFAFLTH